MDFALRVVLELGNELAQLGGHAAQVVCGLAKLACAR